MRALICGAGGRLGSAFVDALPAWDTETLGREHLVASDPDGLTRLVAAACADVVINCAADTDVEGAERHPAAAIAANAVLPGLLARAAAQCGALLVQVSSTGCYGTAKATTPYVEDDSLRPTTAHHLAKAEGEARVRAAGGEHLILRTGWLFGGAPGVAKGFVWKRLLEARGAAWLSADAGQRGNPTFAGDVVRQALALIEAGARGTFNVVSGPSATRAEYVAAIVEAAGLPCRVEPGPPFARLAAVSSNESAENRRLGALGLDRMPPWRESLAAYVGALTASPAWREAA